MYVKNHTFKTGGADDCDCAEILSLIEEGKIASRSHELRKLIVSMKIKKTE